MTACVVTSVLEFLGVIGIMDLYLNFSLVVGRFEVRTLFYKLSRTSILVVAIAEGLILDFQFLTPFCRFLAPGLAIGHHIRIYGRVGPTFRPQDVLCVRFKVMGGPQRHL